VAQFGLGEDVANAAAQGGKKFLCNKSQLIVDSFCSVYRN